MSLNHVLDWKLIINECFNQKSKEKIVADWMVYKTLVDVLWLIWLLIGNGYTKFNNKEVNKIQSCYDMQVVM